MMDLSNMARRSNQVVLYGTEGFQFGKRVMAIQCTVNEVLKFIDIDRNVQRELDTDRVSRIGSYIQYGLDGHDIYLSPLLFSARGRGFYNPENRSFSINTGDRLFVLDGQHRIKAFELLRNRLESMIERAHSAEFEEMYNNLCGFPITLQIFTDLSTEEERQLFTDVNLKASPVHNTLLITYGDTSRDLYAQMTKELITEDTQDLFESRARNTKTKLMTAATLYLLCKVLNEGTFHPRTDVKLNGDNYVEFKHRVSRFLEAYLKMAPKHYLDRDRYIVSMPNVILAIGKYVHDALKDSSNKTNVDILLRRLQGFDWTHRNKELRKLGIDYNHNTQKYKFNAIGRIVPRLSEILMGDLRKRGASV